MVEVGPHHWHLIAKYFNIVFWYIYQRITVTVQLCRVSQRQSKSCLLDVCISPSNYLLYTFIVHSHNPDKLF